MNLDELNDQMAVLAAIQQRQGEILKLEAEEIDAVRARTAELQEQLNLLRATSDQRMKEWDARIEKLVSGFGAFLAKQVE
jgi:hypothetical protein